MFAFNFSGGDYRSLKEPKTDIQANNNAKYQELWPIMRKDLLWTESKDVWYVQFYYWIIARYLKSILSSVLTVVKFLSVSAEIQ